MAAIEFEGPRFGSDGDERALFEWLERIEGVSDVRGRGTRVTFVIADPVSDVALRELIGLYSRYGLAMRDLARFESENNREWFRAPGMFWHDAVFSSD